MKSPLPFLFLPVAWTGVVLFAAVAGAQTPPRAPVVSPEIHADRTVTFRLDAPEAKTVKMWGEWDRKEVEMTRDERGVWSAAAGPVESDLYSYYYKVDGIKTLDPANPAAKPSRSTTDSVLEIPGAKAVPLDLVPGVPRGTVHLHDYESKSLGHTRRLRVYTPAAFDAHPTARLPVLYLFHGSGDNESTWTEFGRANTILDNLIAEKKAVPMIVVMTDGHALTGYGPESRAGNAAAFERDLLEDVLPFVEARYPVDARRETRAILGLSMGGNQAILAGLNHRDLFAWVGGMSSAIREPDKPLASFWAEPVAEKTPLSLLWLTIGTEDFLLKENRAFDALLTARNVPHEYVETPGAHQWTVWRRGLAVFAARAFQPTQPSRE